MKSLFSILLIATSSLTLIACDNSSDNTVAPPPIHITADGKCSPAFMTAVDDIITQTADLMMEVLNKDNRIIFNQKIDFAINDAQILINAYTESGQTSCSGYSNAQYTDLTVYLDGISEIQLKFTTLKKTYAEDKTIETEKAKNRAQQALANNVDLCSSEINNDIAMFENIGTKLIKLSAELIKNAYTYRKTQIEQQIDQSMRELVGTCDSLEQNLNVYECVSRKPNGDIGLVERERFNEACRTLRNSIL